MGAIVAAQTEEGEGWLTEDCSAGRFVQGVHGQVYGLPGFAGWHHHSWESVVQEAGKVDQGEAVGQVMS